MADRTEEGVYDLLFLVDATASMTSYIASLKRSLPQIISLSALTNCFSRIGLLAYRDYSDSELLDWSGWITRKDIESEHESILIKKAANLQATGGGDYPEATKTGLAMAHSLMRKEATTLIFLYTDAPPHMKSQKPSGYTNAAREQATLSSENKYDAHSPVFCDWAAGAQLLANGEKKAQVFSFLSGYLGGHYTFLSTLTNGATIELRRTDNWNISQVTVETLLAWMGVKKEGTTSSDFDATILQYEDPSGCVAISDEASKGVQSYFETGDDSDIKYSRHTFSNDNFRKYVPRKATPLQDFAKTYKQSAAYRLIVTNQLRSIMEQDVTAITLNAVFGSLWRAVCNDRENEHRQELMDLFGRSVDAIKAKDTREVLKEWLEESYDFTAEVLGLINDVPEELRFPCVCLDPTITYEVQPEVDGADPVESENDKPITSFRRDELLEIGRSCDWRILRRLGRILTRLTYIESAADLPAHLNAADQANVPRIPMALASKDHGRQFWRILLHTVVPGTMLGGRAGALLAALSIKLGVKPLRQAAEAEMMCWRDKWNDVEVPETWNTNCLSFLLDADKEYAKDWQSAGIERLSLDDESSLLLKEDRKLFEHLVNYRLLELNINTNLTARVSWTPSKTVMPIGPVIMCQACEYPRSVTMMGTDNKCGLCHCEWPTTQAEEKAKAARVSKLDDEQTNASWVECAMQDCRAQYIVYNIDDLNVRSKCHGCRTMGAAQDQAPRKAYIDTLVECTKCQSRMVWPPEYRIGRDMSDWKCVACFAERQTVVDVETTANALREENGNEWLLRDRAGKITQPFCGRTLYKIVADAGTLDDFTNSVEILPALTSTTPTTLTYHGKPIQNTTAMLERLAQWISRRRAEGGSCSLCFTETKKTDLLRACGRSGCSQRVCKSCLAGWYGMNKAGKILNLAALQCPFCRRPPTPKTLIRHGAGVNAVGGLKEAVDMQGEWVSAWCIACDHAKPYMERVCAQGAPPEIERWACDTCRESKTGVNLPRMTKCPGCGVDVMKISGCDHMTCICGTHFCFVCGMEEEEDEIYNHIANAHPGWADDLQDEYEDDEVDDEDEDDQAHGIDGRGPDGQYPDEDDW